MTTRIYAMKNGDTTRLVRAANQAQAFRHVARTDWTCKPADAETAIAFAATGGKVEGATAQADDDDDGAPLDEHGFF